MKVIGLCGGSGSGKGALSKILSVYGIPSIDADAVYHSITSHISPCVIELAAAFGDEIIVDGSLDRARLRDIVFIGDDAVEKQKLLNSITHKYVIAEIEKELSVYSESGIKAAIIDAPLLFESGLNERCDMVVAVIADREVRIKRICARDGIDRISAERRIDSQISDEWLIKHSDITVINNGDLLSLENEARSLAQIVLK